MTIQEYIRQRIEWWRCWFGWQVCKRIGHNWYADGGRQCPNEIEEGTCSMPTYRCLRCGEYDYGYKGGRGYEDCLSCPNSKVNLRNSELPIHHLAEHLAECQETHITGECEFCNWKQ